MKNRLGTMIIEQWKEPKEVTAIYNDLASNTNLDKLISSKELGIVARRLFDMGYRKDPRPTPKGGAE